MKNNPVKIQATSTHSLYCTVIIEIRPNQQNMLNWMVSTMAFIEKHSVALSFNLEEWSNWPKLNTGNGSGGVCVFEHHLMSNPHLNYQQVE